MNDSFEKTFENDTSEHSIGKSSESSWYKPIEGDNKMRILSTPWINVSRYKYGACYDGAEYCKKENLGKTDSLSYKWLTWIIDRTDGKQKLYNMPFSVTKALTALKTNEEYCFDDFPMPYDVTICVKGAGTKEVEYSIVPSRKEAPVTADELQELSKQSPVEDVIEAMKEKSRKEHGGAEPTGYPDSFTSEQEQEIQTSPEATPVADTTDYSNIPF